MLNLPSTTAFGRRIPKQKFYDNIDVSPEVKRLFIDQIRLITWAHKLSAQTMNLADGQAVQEIEVFHIKLLGDTLDPRAGTAGRHGAACHPLQGSRAGR